VNVSNQTTNTHARAQWHGIMFAAARKEDKKTAPGI
jgi:hypothetical protein